jgi:hypothetical protein
LFQGLAIGLPLVQERAQGDVELFELVPESFIDP